MLHSVDVTKGNTRKDSSYYQEISEYSKLVTPMQNKHLPVYSWYNYKHSFSRNLVWSVIDTLGLDKDDLVLDPFCGAGTTLLASKQKGIPSVGFDLMPLSVLISNVKVGKYDETEVRDKLKKMIVETKDAKQAKGNSLKLRLDKYFPRGELNRLLRLREAINHIDDLNMRSLFLLGMLSIVEDASYTRKDGAFIRTVKDKLTKPVMYAFTEKMALILHDLSYLNSLPEVSSRADLSDARSTHLKDKSVSAVITSPPYPNRHDYTRIYYLELMLGFFDDYDSVKRLRYELLRSHVEAREKYVAEGYNYPEGLEKILADLRKKDLPNRNIIDLVDGYFKDMYVWLNEMHRVLSPEGTINIIIGDARYGGISIPAGSLVKKIGDDIGFEHVKTIKARDKGNSPQQMGKFGKSVSLESIISLKRH